MFLAAQRPTQQQMNAIINSRDLYMSDGLAFTSTATSNTNVPGGSLQFTKQLNSPLSELRVWIFASAFLVAGGPVTFSLGVNIAGIDVDVSYFRFNSVQHHYGWGRVRRLNNFNAGLLTVQLRARNNVGGQQVQFTGPPVVGAGGQISLLVEEILL